MRDLIKKILIESEDEFNWAQELIQDTRTVDIVIHDRKDSMEEVRATVAFTDVYNLIKNIDQEIDDTPFRKVDVYVVDGSNLTKDEITILEREWIMVGYDL